MRQDIVQWNVHISLLDQPLVAYSSEATLSQGLHNHTVDNKHRKCYILYEQMDKYTVSQKRSHL